MSEQLDKFTRAYIQAALWSSYDESDESGGQPLDENYTWEDIAPETLERMKKDCQKFQREAEHLMEDGPADRAGQDFWLTRNGHGAGFWDGDWEHGDELTKKAEAYGESNLYVGDDGQVYGS